MNRILLFLKFLPDVGIKTAWTLSSIILEAWNLSDSNPAKGITLNRAIKLIRQNEGLSQREFGDYLGIDFTWLSRFENERIEIEEAAAIIAPVLPIAARLGEVDLEWLQSLAIVCNPAAEQPAFVCRRRV